MTRLPLPPVALVLAALGVAATAALGGAGGGPDGTAAGTARLAGRPETVPVVGTSAVCPDLRQDGARLATRVSVGVAPAPDVPADDAGALTAVALNDVRGQPARLPVDRPGEVAVDLGTRLNGDALVVAARGPLAAGLEVEQVTRGETGAERGFAGLRCEAPTTQSWFVGGSTVVGDVTKLVLVNADDTPAVVDVAVFTGSGPADGRPGRGLVVPPRTRAAVELDALAPDRDLLALHVQTRRGRVAAAVRHVRFDGRVPRGVDWVPQAVPPAREVVVPGLPQGPGRRTVLVTNPGVDDTVVSIELTTGDGQFVPAGLDAVEVPAGTTVAKEVTALLQDGPAAARVRSDGGPVLAGGFVYDAQTGPVRELAYAGSAVPLTGVAVLTDLVINRPTESALLLSALAQDAAVEVTPVAIVGRPGPLPASKRVAIPAGRTTALRLSTFLPPGATGRLAVEVRPAPGSGPLHASRYLRERGARGPLTTSLVLQGAAQRVERPVVHRDPRAPVG